MSDSKPLGREAILASVAPNDLKTIETTAFGPILIRRWTYGLALSIRDYVGTENHDLAYLIASWVNPDGSPIFRLIPEDFDQLKSLPVQTINELVGVVIESRRSEAETIIKNSTASPIIDLPTA